MVALCNKLLRGGTVCLGSCVSALAKGWSHFPFSALTATLVEWSSAALRHVTDSCGGALSISAPVWLRLHMQRAGVARLWKK